MQSLKCVILRRAQLSRFPQPLQCKGPRNSTSSAAATCRQMLTASILDVSSSNCAPPPTAPRSPRLNNSNTQAWHAALLARCWGPFVRASPWPRAPLHMPARCSPLTPMTNSHLHLRHASCHAAITLGRPAQVHRTCESNPFARRPPSCGMAFYSMRTLQLSRTHQQRTGGAAAVNQLCVWYVCHGCCCCRRRADCHANSPSYNLLFSPTYTHNQNAQPANTYRPHTPPRLLFHQWRSCNTDTTSRTKNLATLSQIQQPHVCGEANQIKSLQLSHHQP